MVDDQLLEILACPYCGGVLHLKDDFLECEKCGNEYQVRNDIPILIYSDRQQFKNKLYEYYEAAGVKDDLFHYKHSKEENLKREVISNAIRARECNYTLDLGSSEGLHTRSLKSVSKNVIAMDISFQRLYKLKFKYKVTHLCVQGDIESLPFKKNIFDFILMTELLEHIPNDKLALKLVKDCLSKTGALLITVPNNEKIQYNHQDRIASGLDIDLPAYGHLHSYTKNSLRLLIENVELNVSEIKEVFARHLPYLERFIPDMITRSISEVFGKLFGYSHLYCLTTKGDEIEQS